MARWATKVHTPQTAPQSVFNHFCMALDHSCGQWTHTHTASVAAAPIHCTHKIRPNNKVQKTNIHTKQNLHFAQFSLTRHALHVPQPDILRSLLIAFSTCCRLLFAFLLYSTFSRAYAYSVHHVTVTYSSASLTPPTGWHREAQICLMQAYLRKHTSKLH